MTRRRVQHYVFCPDCGCERPYSEKPKKYRQRCYKHAMQRHYDPVRRGVTPCRHCGKRKAVIHGICDLCSRDLEVRLRYASPERLKFARRGNNLANPVGREPVPTDARPGTPEKLAVLAARAERGEWLFHPMDAK